MSNSSHAKVDHSAVADSVNASVNYTMYSAFKVVSPLDGVDRAKASVDVIASLAEISGLHVRGWYDVSGFRADADVFVWWWAEHPETLQAAYHVLMASELGRHLNSVWSTVGVHRQAEFNHAHVPAFLAGDDPRGYICVYPFVRSYDWYLLPDDERRKMLRDHGYAARDFGDVLANTVASFALSDYEWLLAFESDELVRIVDLMRELRATEARRHVREEVPFFTGPRVELADLVNRLP